MLGALALYALAGLFVALAFVSVGAALAGTGADLAPRAHPAFARRIHPVALHCAALARPMVPARTIAAMTRTHRRVHRLAWVVLGLVVASGLALALRPAPAAPAARAPVEAAP